MSTTKMSPGEVALYHGRGPSLRGHYGYDSVDRIRYGFKPRECVRTLLEEDES